MAPHATTTPFSSLPKSLLSLSALSTLLLTFPSPSAAWDCKNVLADKVKFDFGKLDGPHVVHWKEEPDWDTGVQFNYNFTIDFCKKLKWQKGGSLKTECPHGTHICGIREDTYLDGSSNSTIHPIAIAGTYPTQNGRRLDEKTELFRNSNANSDVGREGVRVELHGGRFPFDDKSKGIDQRAIIEFVCDKDRTGLEGDEKDTGDKEDDKDGDKDKDKDDGEKDGDKDGDKDKEGDGKLRKREGGQCEDTDNSLRFCGYKMDTLKDDKKVKTLRLEWRTKYACEDAPDDNDSSHWGFFTWFIVIFFLATAAYLIFGSWLNYNRYGARGWDLLPHGDTIRDIPYILKDWARGVKDSLQGSGSRGGYSAV